MSKDLVRIDAFSSVRVKQEVAKATGHGLAVFWMAVPLVRAKGGACTGLAPFADLQAKEEAKEEPFAARHDDAIIRGGCGLLLEGCVHL